MSGVRVDIRRLLSVQLGGMLPLEPSFLYRISIIRCITDQHGRQHHLHLARGFLLTISIQTVRAAWKWVFQSQWLFSQQSISRIYFATALAAAQASLLQVNTADIRLKFPGYWHQRRTAPNTGLRARHVNCHQNI